MFMLLMLYSPSPNRMQDACRVQDKLDEAGISYDMHLFADDSSSDAASIGKLIEQVANKVHAEMVVLAQHNKVCSLKLH